MNVSGVINTAMERTRKKMRSAAVIKERAAQQHQSLLQLI